MKAHHIILEKCSKPVKPEGETWYVILQEKNTLSIFFPLPGLNPSPELSPMCDLLNFRNCMHHSTCLGASGIVFAWAKDAPGTQLPPRVGVRLDPELDGHLVMQVHYAHPLEEKDNSGLAITFTEEK